MIKTFTFAILHFSIAFTVAYILTGDVIVGAAVALIEPAINTIGFYVQGWTVCRDAGMQRAVYVQGWTVCRDAGMQRAVYVQGWTGRSCAPARSALPPSLAVVCRGLWGRIEHKRLGSTQKTATVF